ncbi:MAG TPA: penicillin-binding protein activator [Cytophagaceae bacterium]|jgi:branched-chain amino acid transport system substrate-binding protein|nr:penicillin-binding protein activator [Cytophagaceae bacterium]
MKKVKSIIAISAIALVLAGFSSCDQKPQNDEAKSIKIGAILPLTNSAAFVGIPIKNSILLKVNEFNEHSPTKIQVVFEDSQADVKEAVFAFEKLNSQGIKIVLGPVTSGEVLATAPIAEKNKIILFSPSASAQNITNAGDYIFRNELSDLLGATMQARLAINRLHWKKISILYTDNDYGEGVKSAFKKEFEQLGGTIETAISFKGGTTDFRTQILKLKSYQNDAVFVIAQAEYPTIINQFIENKVPSKIYATPIFEDPSFIQKIGKKNSDGIIYTYYGTFNLQTEDSVSKSFIDQYKSKYNIEPTYYGALGYDNISILIEALKRSNFDIEKTKASLYAIQKFPGVTGEISFDKNGDVSKPITLKIVRDGAFTYY